MALGPVSIRGIDLAIQHGATNSLLYYLYDRLTQCGRSPARSGFFPAIREARRRRNFLPMLSVDRAAPDTDQRKCLDHFLLSVLSPSVVATR